MVLSRFSVDTSPREQKNFCTGCVKMTGSSIPSGIVPRGQEHMGCWVVTRLRSALGEQWSPPKDDIHPTHAEVLKDSGCYCL